MPSNRARRFSRCALLLALTLSPTLAARPCWATEAKPGSAAELPDQPAEIAPFMAKLDDQQARATLARVLEDRTKDREPARPREMLVDLDRVTKTIGDRVRDVAGAKEEVLTAPSVYWQWLSDSGSDRMAAVRALISAAVVIVLAWLAQRAVGAAALRALARRRETTAEATLGGVAVVPLRWIVFLGVAGFAHIVTPQLSRPSRLTALAIVVAFAATWIGSGLISVVLPALFIQRGPAAWGVRLRLLRVALAVSFIGLFGLGLLRQAGVSDNARFIIACAVWLAFAAFFLIAFGRVRQPAQDLAPELEPSGRPSIPSGYGLLLLRISFVAILVIAPVVAMVQGPSAFWSGLESFGLLALFVAVLGLTRPKVERFDSAPTPSPWATTWRRGMQVLAGVALTIALASVWGIELAHQANAQLGERLAGALLTIGITVVLTYLAWEVIRTALALHVIGPSAAEAEPGEEGGGTAATRLQTFGPVLRNFLLVVLLTVATMVCLSAIGVDIGPLLAGAGVIGIALGFGAQTLVRDIISGVFYLAEDAFRVGEYISIGTTRGTVEGIAIRSLRLRHHRGPIHTVPFGEIKQLTNYSRDWIIMKLEFLLAFDTDLAQVKKVVKAVGKELEAHPELGRAILAPIKSQGVRRMEPTGMVVGVKFMATPGSEVYLLRREVYQRVLDAFEANGIQFARPQIVVAAPHESRHGTPSRAQLAAGLLAVEGGVGTR
jgi:small-conductance mechanosensitive channel